MKALRDILFLSLYTSLLSSDKNSTAVLPSAANSRNRGGGGGGGGVPVYYRSILNVINRENLIPEDIEAICLSLNPDLS